MNNRLYMESLCNFIIYLKLISFLIIYKNIKNNKSNFTFYANQMTIFDHLLNNLKVHSFALQCALSQCTKFFKKCLSVQKLQLKNFRNRNRNWKQKFSSHCHINMKYRNINIRTYKYEKYFFLFFRVQFSLIVFF